MGAILWTSKSGREKTEVRPDQEILVDTIASET
jgi:hypothetical protein